MALSDKHVLVVHGGAGIMSREGSTPAQRAAYKAGLRDALVAGYNILHNGGEAMDAVVAAASIMEAAKAPYSTSTAKSLIAQRTLGLVLTPAFVSQNELEASLMLSKPPASASHPAIPPSRRGLGATLLTRTRNPSQLVRALYLAPSAAPHVFLSGAAAESLGESLGVHLVDPSYFFTERRWREHRRGLGLPEDPLPEHRVSADADAVQPMPALDQLPAGTVGAVALDGRGCIAVLTSTGGRTNKLVGRIGDTPSMGSGYWAEQWSSPQGNWFQKLTEGVFNSQQGPRAVGVSGTGDGDYFIRLNTAVTIARRIQYLHEPLEAAAQTAVEDLRVEGGSGGVIALDDLGNGVFVSLFRGRFLTPFLVSMPKSLNQMRTGGKIIIRSSSKRICVIYDLPYRNADGSIPFWSGQSFSLA
ncbi:hypothetical protein C0993_004442 [Termitomyces sp. T159_Od127]|nr:hypothetical protein C0993_004442 [Termitomyces sp. T159_Od127]